MPEGKRDAIFDPFIQAESNVSRRVSGAGLGLPISRRLSEAMGGNLVLLKTGDRRLDLPRHPAAGDFE